MFGESNEPPFFQSKQTETQAERKEKHLRYDAMILYPTVPTVNLDTVLASPFALQCHLP